MTDSQQIQLVRLFCLRSDGPTENLSEDELRDGLNIIDDETFHVTKAVFQRKGFIDENWSVLKWGKRQFLSNSSTERVRKHRAKSTKKQDETLQKQHETQNVTDQNRTEQNRTEHKKPSADPADRPEPKKKEPSKSAIAKSRHAEFKAAIAEYWEAKNPGVPMPWDGAEGKQLEMWLKATPAVTLEQFKNWLRNRYRSDVVHSERPSRWVADITRFANGPVNRFRQQIEKPKTALDGMEFDNVPKGSLQ